MEEIKRGQTYNEDIFLIEDPNEIQEKGIVMSHYLTIVDCLTGGMRVTNGNKMYEVGRSSVYIGLPSVLRERYERTWNYTGPVLCVKERIFEHVLGECLRLHPDWYEKKLFLEQSPVMPVTAEQQKILLAYTAIIRSYMECEATNYHRIALMQLGVAIMYELMNLIEEQMIATDSNPEVMLRMNAQELKVRDFLRMLGKYAKTHRSVAWYAEQMHISAKYLSTAVKQKTGRTGREMIDSYSLSHVRYYLLQTDLSVKEIATELNFPDATSFCKYVRDHLHTSPLQYRREMIKAQGGKKHV